MGIFNILSPVLLLVLLGIFLARIRFAGPIFMGELSRFTFYVALPASLFRSTAASGDSGPEVAGIITTVLAASLLAAVAGWVVSVAIRLPASSHSAVAQSSFRANLAYIGLPVLAIIVLQAGRHRLSWSATRPVLQALCTNPLLISCAAGLSFSALHWSIPVSLERMLDALGAAAVPMALICIGGSIAFIKLGRHIAGMLAAVGLKLVFVPAIVFAIGTISGLATVDLRIAMVFAACPTAAAAFVMARQMEGDEAIASGSIVLSTIFSSLALTVSLWLTR